MDSSLRELLDRIPEFRGRDAEVTPLAGGITNRNFRVDVGGSAYVLRVASPESGQLGIRRDHECACMRIAASLGIGAEVVRAMPDDGVLVARFLDGEPLSLEQAKEPERLKRIVQAIRRFHDGPAFPGPFSPFETVRDYHRRALERGVHFPDELPEAFARMARIEDAVAGRQRCVPCHNDLLAANLIDDGEKIWIIDWEYAAMGDPFFDLGNFAVNQALSAGESDRLLAHYFGEIRERDRAQLELMKLASDIREAFWGFLQSGISALDFDYPAYGMKHVERFLTGASRPEFDAWIESFAGGARR